MLKVKDCITREVITANRGTPLKDIIKFFKENNFHILPVVNGDNNLVGKISFDEITSVFQPHSTHISQLLETIPFLDTAASDVEIDIDCITPEMGVLVVADEIMSKQYFTINPQDSIAKAYSVMKINDTKVLMVCDEDKLTGVIGMFDIIYAMFKEKGVVE